MSFVKYIGLTLVEMLIAVLLSLAVIVIVFKVYISAEKGFELFSSLHSIQSNAQKALEILETEVRQAGYIGCAKLTEDFPIQGYQRYTLTPENKIHFSDQELTVRHASWKNAILINPMYSFERLEVASNIHFKAKSIVLIADCFRGEIFQIKHVSHSQGMQIVTPAHALHHLYGKFSEISFFEINRFFIQDGFLMLENVHKSKYKLVNGCTNLTFFEKPLTIQLALKQGDLTKTWYANA